MLYTSDCSRVPARGRLRGRTSTISAAASGSLAGAAGPCEPDCGFVSLPRAPTRGGRLLAEAPHHDAGLAKQKVEEVMVSSSFPLMNTASILQGLR